MLPLYTKVTENDTKRSVKNYESKEIKGKNSRIWIYI